MAQVVAILNAPHTLGNRFGDLQRTWEQIHKAKKVDDVYIVTDSIEIHDAAIAWGCAPDHALVCAVGEGHTRLPDTVRYVVRVRGDLPHIDPNDIDRAVKAMANELDMRIVAVSLRSRVTDEAVWRDPAVIKIACRPNGTALLMTRAPIPHTKQGAFVAHPDTCFALVDAVVFRRDFLPLYRTTPDTPLQLHEGIEYIKILEMGYEFRALVTEHPAARGVENRQAVRFIVHP